MQVQCQTLDDPDLVSFETASKRIVSEVKCRESGSVTIRYAVECAGRYVCQVNGHDSFCVD